jgi:hypothetical protein
MKGIYITEQTKHDLIVKLIQIELNIKAQESLTFPVDFILGSLYAEKEIIHS